MSENSAPQQADFEKVLRRADATGGEPDRFIAGLGIGGAPPTSTTMAAEYTPARRRTLAVTATIVCVPSGA